MTASDSVRQRLRIDGVTFAANECIADHLLPGEADALEVEVAGRCADLLDSLVIDTENDHNTAGTAKRLARMFVRELFKGRYEPRPVVTDFPNAGQLDELYTVGPVTIRSTCSHHFCAIEGSAWCGIIPGGRVIGLSKFARLTDWVMSRPQIQEEATIQLANEIEASCDPMGLALVVRARHSCMTMRGVRETATHMTTSVMRGALRDNSAARAEFLALVRMPG